MLHREFSNFELNTSRIKLSGKSTSSRLLKFDYSESFDNDFVCS